MKVFTNEWQSNWPLKPFYTLLRAEAVYCEMAHWIQAYVQDQWDDSMLCWLVKHRAILANTPKSSYRTYDMLPKNPHAYLHEHAGAYQLDDFWLNFFKLREDKMKTYIRNNGGHYLSEEWAIQALPQELRDAEYNLDNNPRFEDNLKGLDRLDHIQFGEQMEFLHEGRITKRRTGWCCGTKNCPDCSTPGADRLRLAIERRAQEIARHRSPQPTAGGYDLLKLPQSVPTAPVREIVLPSRTILPREERWSVGNPDHLFNLWNYDVRHEGFLRMINNLLTDHLSGAVRIDLKAAVYVPGGYGNHAAYRHSLHPKWRSAAVSDKSKMPGTQFPILAKNYLEFVMHLFMNCDFQRPLQEIDVSQLWMNRVAIEVGLSFSAASLLIYPFLPSPRVQWVFDYDRHLDALQLVTVYCVEEKPNEV